MKFIIILIALTVLPMAQAREDSRRSLQPIPNKGDVRRTGKGAPLPEKPTEQPSLFKILRNLVFGN
jgi:hypothetical protein